MFKNRLRHIGYSIILWVTFLFIPTQSAHAQWGIEILTAPFVFLVKAGTAIILSVPLSFGLVYVGQIFLDWTSNPNLTGGVTRNQFIMDAWAIVRDFSNLFFILIIVAIGIATALRIKSYEVKKTLPKLIVVAVLINFSPVICGVVIDVANIFMNFFLTAGAAGFGETISTVEATGRTMMSALSDVFSRPQEIFNGVLLFKVLTVTVFNIFFAFIFFIMGGMFLIRHIVLWILVILSPLAFLGAIFESGGKDAKKLSMFGKWKEEFIKWTFVGVSGGLFVYLAQLMMHQGMTVINSHPATQASQYGGQFLSNLMVMTVPMLFLYVGYITTMSAAPAGAKAAIGFSKKWLGKVNPMTKSGRNTIAGLRDTVRNTRTHQKVAGSKLVQKTVSRMEGRAQRAVSSKGPAMRGPGKRFRQLAASKIIARTKESTAVEIDKHKAEADKIKTTEMRQSKYQRSKDDRERLGTLQSAVDNGEIGDYDGQEVTRMMLRASEQDSGSVKKLIKSSPHLALALNRKLEQDLDEANEYNDTGKRDKTLRTMKDLKMTLTDDDIENGIDSYEKKLASQYKSSKDINGINPEAWTDENFGETFRKAAAEIWDGGMVSTAGRELGRSFTNAIQSTFDSMSADEISPKIKTYLESSGARNLGLHLPEHIAEAQEKEKEKKDNSKRDKENSNATGNDNATDNDNSSPIIRPLTATPYEAPEPPKPKPAPKVNPRVTKAKQIMADYKRHIEGKPDSDNDAPASDDGNIVISKKAQRQARKINKKQKKSSSGNGYSGPRYK